MALVKGYFPCLTSRESECRALAALAEPTKDKFFPLVRLQAWPRQKSGAGGPVQRSIDYIKEAYGNRALGCDLASPRTDLATDWARLGQNEIAALRNPADGFGNWCELIAQNPTFVPCVQWTDDILALRLQVERLASIGRGLILRFRRSHGWNISQLANLQGQDVTGLPVLLVFDYEQIGLRDDLTLAGLGVQSAMLAARNLLPGKDLSFVFTASSFPSSFADIDPAYAKLEIRERQLFDMLRTSVPILQAGIKLHYGDHASVFVADREPAFRGAPRVDYPTRSRWIYHRCKSGFADAVHRVYNDPDWDEKLLCWGAQRIRVAAGGEMKGLGSQGPWVTIRLNIHMHLQSHFDDGGTVPIEEEWVD